MALEGGTFYYGTHYRHSKCRALFTGLAGNSKRGEGLVIGRALREKNLEFLASRIGFKGVTSKRLILMAEETAFW